MMRRFYFLTAIVLALISWNSARADYSATVKVYLSAADAALCTASVDGEDVALKEGVNVFTYDVTENDHGSYYKTLVLMLNDREGYTFSGCTMEKGDEKQDMPGFSSSYVLSVGINADNNGWTLYPEISSLADMRTAKATVTIEDASKVRIACGGYEPTLVSGKQTISFNPTSESSWMLGPSGSDLLASVKHNGKEVTSSGMFYYLTMADGDNLEIATTMSTAEVDITFEFANPGTANVLKNVSFFEKTTSTSTPVENFRDGFTAKPGSTLRLELDHAGYNVQSVYANSEALDASYGDIYYDVTGATAFRITATSMESATIPFTITDPEHISVSVYVEAEDSMTEVKNLKAGENAFAVNPSMTYVRIAPNEGCSIDKVTCKKAGKEETVEATGGVWYLYDPAEMEAITVASHMVARDSGFVFYVDDPKAVNEYTFYLKSATDNYLFSSDAVAGYSVYEFDPTVDNDFTLGFSGPEEIGITDEVYLNGAKVAPAEGTHTYTLTLAPADVLKVYPTSTPETCTVQFSLQGDLLSMASLTVDKVTKVEALNDDNALDVLSGTEFVLTPADNSGITGVEINGKALEAADGSYTFAATGSMLVNVLREATGSNYVKVTVDDPERVGVFTGEIAASKVAVAGMTAGVAKEVEVAADAYLWIVPSEGNELTGLTATDANGKAVEVEAIVPYEGADAYYKIEVSGIAAVAVTSQAKKGENPDDPDDPTVDEKMRAVLYVTNVSAANFFDLTDFDSHKIYFGEGSAAKDGYQDFYLDKEEANNLLLAYSAKGDPDQVYLNGDKQPTRYEGSTSYDLVMKPGDVVKVFLGEKPHSGVLTIDDPDMLAESITADHITDLSGTTSISALEGTEVWFELAGDAEVCIDGDKAAATKVEAGRYTYTIDGLNHTISFAKPTGVSLTEAEGADSRIFNLQGMEVRGEQLPAGIYIRNGRKFVVR